MCSSFPILKNYPAMALIAFCSILSGFVGVSLMLSSGCVGPNATFKTDAEIHQAIVDHQHQIRLGATLATRVALVSLEEGPGREETGRLLDEVSAAVVSALSDNADTAQVQDLVIAALSRSDARKAAAALKDLVDASLRKHFASAAPGDPDRVAA